MPSGTIGSATGANNVTGVAADYTSIANWEAAIDGNNQTGTVIYIGGAIDTSPLTLNAAYSGMLLTAHADAALNAPTYAAATSRARLAFTSGDGLQVYGTGFTIEKISVTSSGDIAIYATQGFEIRRCAVFNSVRAIRCDTSGAVKIANCAFFGNTVIDIWAAGNAIAVYHTSMLLNSGYGLYETLGGVITCFACIRQGSVSGMGSGAGEYNVSQGTDATGSSSTKYYRSTSGWFNVTTASYEDLSLATGAKGKWVADGKDAIADYSAQDCGTDIVGTTRAAPIDPGVWQTPAAGGMLKRFAWLGGLGRPISSLTGGLHG